MNALGAPRDGLVATALGLICGCLYIATLTPGLEFPVMDGHELTVNAVRLGVPHPSGYPLYTWLGFLFVHLVPVGDAAYRMNLLSAASAAVGVGLLYLVGRRLGLVVGAAAASASVFGVSTTFWSQAVITEVYAADVALLLLTLWWLLAWADEIEAGRGGSWHFLGFALAFGLSLGTHLSNLGFAPAFALFVLLTHAAILRRPGLLLAAAGLFVLGAAQYFWLPLRGGQFDQYPNPTPTTLAGMYAYTFGTAPTQRFAFPLAVLPLRLILYLRALRENVSMLGIAFGAGGMWCALWAQPVRFWLLIAMYLSNVLVFSQFAVPDVEVFFVAGYVVWALFVGFFLQAAAAFAARRLPPASIALQRTVGVAAAGAVAAWILATGFSSFRVNDRTGDTVAGDFGRNVYDLLPPRSFLLAARGAFGAEALYWQVAEQLRPDVTVLGQAGAPARPPGVPYFTTVRTADGRPTPTGQTGHDPSMFPPGAWYVPVLLGNAYALTLVRVDAEPPVGLLSAGPALPEIVRADWRTGDVQLLEATPTRRSGTPRLAISSAWRLPQVQRVVVSTRVDNQTLESHQLGLGNLLRYATEIAAPANPVVREAYEVVLPSTLPRGTYAVRLGVTEFGATGFETHWMDVGDVDVD